MPKYRSLQAQGRTQRKEEKIMTIQVNDAGIIINGSGHPLDYRTLCEAHNELVAALQEILDGNTVKARDRWNHAEVIQNHYQIARDAIARATEAQS